jgi:hypothetical protein
MKLHQLFEPSGKHAGAPVVVIPLFAPQARVHSLNARAVANIAEWSTYLPKGCVEAMVRDGWHLTV